MNPPRASNKARHSDDQRGQNFETVLEGSLSRHLKTMRIGRFTCSHVEVGRTRKVR